MDHVDEGRYERNDGLTLFLITNNDVRNRVGKVIECEWRRSLVKQ
jgi:hypothetical protein